MARALIELAQYCTSAAPRTPSRSPVEGLIEAETVPITHFYRSCSEDYRPSATSSWYFPSPLGKRWDPDNFSQLLREINLSHGMKRSCLDFRHTFGSHLAMKGESLYKISELMGNSPDLPSSLRRFGA